MCYIHKTMQCIHHFLCIRIMRDSAWVTSTIHNTLIQYKLKQTKGHTHTNILYKIHIPYTYKYANGLERSGRDQSMRRSQKTELYCQNAFIIWTFHSVRLFKVKRLTEFAALRTVYWILLIYKRFVETKHTEHESNRVKKKMWKK